MSEREKERFPFKEDDIRVRRREKEPKPKVKAVVFLIMDVSGSMDKLKITITKGINGRFARHLRRKPEFKEVKIVFIVHETHAEEVPEGLFFKRLGDGGTCFSSAYEEVLKQIKETYNPRVWNIYMTHSTDGENYGANNDQATKLLKKILKVANLVGYFETKSHSYNTNLKVFEPLKQEFDNFKAFKVEGLTDINPALEEFLKDE